MKALASILVAGMVAGVCARAEDVPEYLRHAHGTILEPFVDGVALEVPEAVAAQPSAAAGFVDVTRPPFGADPTGAADCTVALQKAIDFARDRQIVCFFPPGTYRVSNTLSCVRQLYRRKNGRVFGAFYHPCVIEGSRAGASRPRLLLSPRSPGFGDPDHPRHVVHFWARGYANPTTDGKVTDGRGAEEDQPMQGQVCLVDSTIDVGPAGGPTPARVPAIRSTRSLYLNNVYVRGAGVIAANPEDGFSLAARPDGWTHVLEFARGPAAPSGTGGKPGASAYRFPVWIDGGRRETLEARTAAGTPPADLQSRHLWPAAFPHRELPGAVSVKDAPYGAKGDGRADDTEPLQRAVNAADVVFLPKCYYRVTRPIDLRPGTRMVGAAQHLSILVATGPEGAFADPANPAPLVRSADDAASDAILANCGLWAPRNLDGARETCRSSGSNTRATRLWSGCATPTASASSGTEGTARAPRAGRCTGSSARRTSSSRTPSRARRRPAQGRSPDSAPIRESGS